MEAAYPKNIAKLFRDTAKRYPDKRALLYKEQGRYQAWSWGEVRQRVESVATAMRREGLAAGDRLAILAENGPSWALVDLAAQHLGVATVPIYTSLTPPEIEYILMDCGAKAVAVSSRALFEKVALVQRRLPNLRWVLGFDSAIAVSRNTISIPLHLIRDFESTASDPTVASASDAIESDAVASIIYTSGTTGQPKGVQLTQGNFIHNVVGCRDTLKMGDTDIHLSFLPLSHVFERTAGYYLMVYIGATIAYAENMDTVSKNILEVRPTFLLGVPRFYEKIQVKVLESVKTAGPFKKGLFFWAKELGEGRRLEHRKNTAKERFKDWLADKLVYSKFRSRLGGRLRFGISGGAPIAREVLEFFSDLGVKIYEGYGLTETSPVIAVNREGKYRFGTVGVPLAGVQVKICDDGEIATKSPSVMKGYFNKPAETEAVLKDGWFFTGDLGRMDREGFLAITGRKKELLVTSGGKKVAPRPIEERLEKDDFILRCVLFGEGKKFITAILVPKKDALVSYAESQKILFDSYEALVRDQKIHAFLDSRVQGYMTELASYERIKYFLVLPNDFSQEAGELTPTLKVKRETVFSRHKEAIQALYDQHASAE